MCAYHIVLVCFLAVTDVVYMEHQSARNDCFFASESGFGNHSNMSIYDNFRIIYINVNATMSINRRWIWTSDMYRYMLSYPEDINVYTLGIMHRRAKNLELKIDNKSCSDIVDSNVFDFLSIYLKRYGHKGKLCRNVHHIPFWRRIMGRAFSIAIDNSFECYELGKQTVDYERINPAFVVFLSMVFLVVVVCFYPMILSLAFHKKKAGNEIDKYYCSSFPYGPTDLFIKLIFKANYKNSGVSALRISLFITLLLVCVAIAKHELSPELTEHQGNYFSLSTLTSMVRIISEVIICIFLNMFIIYKTTKNIHRIFIVNITNLFNSGYIIRCLPVSIFQTNVEHNKTVTSCIIDKFTLVLSLKFWLTIALMPFNRLKQKGIKNVICSIFFAVIQLPINMFLIFGTTICPMYSIMLYTYMFISEPFLIKSKKCSKGSLYRNNFLSVIVFLIVNLVSFRMFYYLFYEGSFLLHGMSYLMQMIMYTCFVALPHFSASEFQVFLFIAMVTGYLLRYVYEFLLLYKNLLNTILQVTKTTYVAIQDYEKVVCHTFPLKREIFFLAVKLAFAICFFIIIFDTIQKIGYLDNLNLNTDTGITLLFVFGPPKLFELLFLQKSIDKIDRKHVEIEEFLSRENVFLTYDASEQNELGLNTFELVSYCQSYNTRVSCGSKLSNCCCSYLQKCGSTGYDTFTEISESDIHEVEGLVINHCHDEQFNICKYKRLNQMCGLCYAILCGCCKYSVKFNTGECVCCTILTEVFIVKDEEKKMPFNKRHIKCVIPCLKSVEPEGQSMASRKNGEEQNRVVSKSEPSTETELDELLT